jgi:sn-glycerol 3-phosphate transport system ATP-binding protein
MASVTLTGLRKRYGPLEVLHGVDCAIADGELIVIVGPSGCGKSTLLRMIAGLESVTEGEIRIGERLVNDVEPKDRDIAMVFQNYALYPHMSVFDNMAYGLKIRGLAKAEIRSRVERAADILQLGALLARKPGQLSGGQRQRVAMGRAIVREPALFLFDEPLSNLDAQLRGQMRVELKQLQQRLGTTSIYVTHDQVEAMTLADRLIVLKDGAVEQIGRPIELYERPATIFVAGFIGAPPINLVPAALDGKGRALLAGGVTIETGAALAVGTEAMLGIRPEHVRLDEVGYQLTVQLVERLGADSILHGMLDCGAALRVRVPGVATTAPGTNMRVSLPREALHLFDRATGRRLALGG